MDGLRAVFLIMNEERQYSHISLVSLPNGITALRLVLVFPMLFFLQSGHEPWVAALFPVAMLSDALDGWLARRLGVVSQLGAWLDATADKVLLWGLTGFLAFDGQFPALAAIAVLGRDLLLWLMALLQRWRGTALVVRPSMSGKLAIAAQMMLIELVLLGQEFGQKRILTMRSMDILAWSVVILSGTSLISYMQRWHQQSRVRGCRA